MPEAIIAFLLLLVKTIGREIILNRPGGVLRVPWLIAESPKPALIKTFVPQVSVADVRPKF